MDRDDPIDPIEQADPTDQIEQADPIEPTDSTEPLQPIDRKEPSDHNDKGTSCAMRPTARRRPGCPSAVTGRAGSKARDMTLAPLFMGAPSQLLACVGAPRGTSYDHNSNEMANGPPRPGGRSESAWPWRSQAR